MTDEEYRGEFSFPGHSTEPRTLTGPQLIQYHGKKPTFQPDHLRDEWLTEAESVMETIRRKALDAWTALLLTLPPAPSGTFWVPVFDTVDHDSERPSFRIRAELASEEPED